MTTLPTDLAGRPSVIQAGRAENQADSSLFPAIDLYHWGRPRAIDAFGPNRDAVAAVLRQAAGLDALGIERIGSMWGHGNSDHMAAQRDEREVRAAIVAVASDRRDAVRAAFLDGQLAILGACEPMAMALEHWWHNYPEVPAMFAAAHLAAATVVADRIKPEALEVAQRPFIALEIGLPSGLFGPHHDAVASIIESVAFLTREHARRIELVWSREPTGDLANFGYPGPLKPERGIDGWMPRNKGRRHFAWIDLLERVGQATRAERRFGWATNAASHRIRAAAEPRGTPELRGAIEAAIAATMFADLAPASLVAELTEAWRSRDGDVDPSTWWPGLRRFRAHSSLHR